VKNIVLYIGSIFLPDKSAGAQRSLSLSKSLRDIGMRVVIVGMDAELPAGTPILKTKGECEGFETYAVLQPKSKKQWAHHTVSIAEYIKIVDYYGLENVHSIVTMEYEAVALWKLSRYCRKTGIHLIADAEEWYEHSHLPFPMNAAKNLDTNLRMYIVYPKKIHNMICISRFFEQKYADRVENRVYIPGTIDIAQAKWKDLPAYRPNEVFTIGYAGHPGLQFEKERLDWLVQAVSELNREGHPCRLKIAGVDRTFMDSRMDVAENDANVIEYLGKIPHRQCLEMIASCDFSAIVREDKRVTKAGFPTKFSESFGCGTPVLTTASSNVREYITDETGVLCDGFSEPAVKAALLRAMQTAPDTLTEMHTSLRENPPLVYQRFTDSLKVFFNRLL